MKLRYITYLFFALLFVYSCGDDDTTYNYTLPSKDAQIYSFSLAATHLKEGDSLSRAQDSLRFVEFNKTKFAIDQVNGVIYNRDSLPYGLKLGDVMMTLSLNPSYSASKVEIVSPDSTFAWSSGDSVNFSKELSLIVTAYDQETTKPYLLDIRIHQIDPDTIIWNKVGLMPTDGDEQKVVLSGSTLYSYVIQSGVVSLYTSSTSNLSWTLQALSGLPSSGVDINSITFYNESFVLITDSGDSYSSIDGKNWNLMPNGINIVSILGVLPNGLSDGSLLFVLKENNEYYFGISTDLSSINKIEEVEGYSDVIKSGFPIKGSADLTNYTSDKRNSTLLLIGGTDRNGDELNSTWMARWTSDGLEIIPSVKNEFFKGEGLSAFFYNNQLYALAENQFYTSALWGTSWVEAPTKQRLIPAIEKRSHQSLIVDDKNYIWIFGGVSESNIKLNDIWKGRLNSLIVK